MQQDDAIIELNMVLVLNLGMQFVKNLTASVCIVHVTT
jgi:hypothetical protein